MKIDWSKAKAYFKSNDGEWVPLGPITNVTFGTAKDGEKPPEEIVHVQEDTTPDYIEPIVGWRAWGVESSLPSLLSREMTPYPPPPTWYLNSVACPYYHKAWKFKIPARAGCFCGTGSESYFGSEETLTGYSTFEDFRFERRQQCTTDRCGLYASTTKSDLLYELMRVIGYLLHDTIKPLVVGSVNLWGRVDVHERGYRADYAYPQELWLVEDTFYDLALACRRSLNSCIMMVREQLEESYGVPVGAIGLRSLVQGWADYSNRKANLVAVEELAKIVYDLNVKFCTSSLSSREGFILTTIRDLLIILDGRQIPDIYRPSSHMDFKSLGYR